MEQLANLVFAAVIVAIVFGYSAYRERKQAEVDRLLIEAGKADAVLEVRRQRRERAWGMLKGSRRSSSSLLVALGSASILSAAVLRLAGLGERYGNADVWALVFGIFLVALALAYALEGRRDQGRVS
jgi:hypothetical protein